MNQTKGRNHYLLSYLCIVKRKRIAFQTLGCKLNFSETSEISRKFIEKGYEVVDHKHETDIYVLNSCTVTMQADKKCRAAIRQAQKRSPQATIIVTGCLSQLKADEIAKMDGVDIVLGNAEKFNLLEHINEFNDAHKKISHVELNLNKTSFYSSYSYGDRTRSFVKVQDGCDYFCSYCIIPSARGRSRSDTIENTIKTIKKIAGMQVKEIILTGVNIGDFGKNNDETFFDLIRKIDKVDGVARYRISSIEPDLLHDDIIDFIAGSDSFLPHFHIPLQSGSDNILKLMNRKYDTKLFADRLEKIKSVLPYSCIATDVIVGFPGETDEDFIVTLEFIRGIDISYVHVFSYSERPGTKASKMENQVNPEKIKERSKLLHELSVEKKLAFYKENTGRTVKVLFESKIEDGFVFGFSENYIKVKTKYDKDIINNIKEVTLNDLDEKKLVFEASVR